MTENPDPPETLSARVARDFSDMRARIVEEWPAVEEAALAATGGDLDKLVELIAEKTGHSKTLVRAHLDEIHGVVSGTRARLGQGVDEMKALLAKLEGTVRSTVEKDAKRSLTENPLLTLLVTLLVGAFLGFLMRGGGGRR